MNRNARKKIDLSCKWKHEWCELIDECILGSFAERDRKILKRALLDGATNEVIAEEMVMSRAQIQRIVSKRTEELYSALKK